jgi:hypothetical protein
MTAAPMRSSRGWIHSKFLDRSRQRDHDLRLDNDAAFRAIRGGFKDGTHLHLDDLRHGNGETHAAQAHHRVGFVHAFDGGKQVLFGFQAVRLAFDAHRDHFFEEFFLIGHELMQRRVNEADDDRVAVHRFEETVKVLALMRQ